MPIGLSKAPKVLPRAAQQLWVDTFNGVLEDCEGTTEECDQRAARIAWDQIKGKYRKVKDKWIAKSEHDDTYHDIYLTITKASLQPDGSVRWQAVASDTGKDKAGERTSTDLFQDWIDRVTFKSDISYLPKPKMPFLGVSHYPALEGQGEAGITRRMYTDGDCFKADGIFAADNPVGGLLLDAVKSELSLIKKGQQIEKPIRISAGWWDIQHYHEDSNYLFTRQSLADKCPLCEKGQTTDKIYKAGQLDHFAATRVPMNVRTSLELKSMAKQKITRMEDAESIIGPEAAEELERQARIVGKSDTEEELPEAMITRADDEDGEDEADITKGGYMRDMRKRRKMAVADVAKAMEISQAKLRRLEADEDEMDETVMASLAEVLKATDKEKEDLLARFGKKRHKEPPKHKAETEGPETFSAVAYDALLRDASTDNEAEYIAETIKAAMNDDDEMGRPRMPLGGATSIKEAEDYIAAQEKMDKMYSYWDMLQLAYGNIQRDMEMDPPAKLKAVSNLFKEMGGKIDTLKAGLSDAFLIQESAAVYDDNNDYLEDDDLAGDEIITEDDEVQIMSLEQKLEEARKAALEDKSLTRGQQEEAIQKAFNEYAQTVQGELDEANPVPVGDQVADALKGALSDVLGPLTEQIGLLNAKMAQQEQPQEAVQTGMIPVHVPQQKSMAMNQPQPVQTAQTGEHHISPVTGKPSPLTDRIRRSVGAPV
jgi:transcriptional regulator with XRE-family HTH domain